MEAPKWMKQLDIMRKRMVSFELHHKETNTQNTVEDITREMFLEDIIEAEESVQLKFEQNISIRIPKHAQFIDEGNKFTFTYETSQKETIIIILTRIHFNHPKTIRVPLINERRDREGNITKLIIDIPPQNISKQQLESLSEMLHEIISEWDRISLAKRTAGTLTWVHKNAQFKELTVLELPGESFLQCVGTLKGSIITVDIPTSFIVHISQKRISFEFDSVQYELTTS